MTPSIPDLLRPNTAQERLSLEGAIVRIFDNEDFQIVFRHMNAASGGILSTSFALNDPDPIRAAYCEGEKVHVRELLSVFLASINQPEKKHETTD